MVQSETINGPVWNHKWPRVWTAWNHKPLLSTEYDQPVFVREGNPGWENGKVINDYLLSLHRCISTSF